MVSLQNVIKARITKSSKRRKWPAVSNATETARNIKTTMSMPDLTNGSMNLGEVGSSVVTNLK